MTEIKNFNDMVKTEDFSAILNLSEAEKAEHDSFVRSQNKAETEFKNKSRFEKCGISERYFNVTFDNYNVTEEKQKLMKDTAIHFCDEVDSGKYKNLLLLGTSGTGKTHLSVSVLRHFSKKIKNYVYEVPVYYSICYVTAAELNQKMHTANSFSSKYSEEDIVNDYADYDILVIDEIGRSTSNYESKILFMILDKRNAKYKSTVLVTNFNFEQFTQFIGTAAWSRLTEDKALLMFDSSKMTDYRINMGA